MNIGVIVKASKFCNLRCSYCYEMPDLAKTERMPLERVELLYDRLGTYLCDWSVEGDAQSIEFIWHGGEPFAQPLPYWQGVLEGQARVFGSVSPQAGISNSIQSNLTLIAEKHLPVLRSVQLGFSFDVINDLRVDLAGRPTAEAVERKIEWLRGEGIKLGGVAVISTRNIGDPRKIADYFLSRNLSFRALPVYQATDQLPGAREAACSFADYLAFFKDLYCLASVQSAMQRGIRVEPLSTTVDMMRRAERGTVRPASLEACVSREWMLAVDINGDVYPPGDFYDPEFRYGNLFQQDLEAVLYDSKPRDLRIARSVERLKSICEGCFLYLRGCDGTFVSHATPEEVRDFRRHGGCYFSLLAGWIQTGQAVRA